MMVLATPIGAQNNCATMVVDLDFPELQVSIPGCVLVPNQSNELLPSYQKIKIPEVLNLSGSPLTARCKIQGAYQANGQGVAADPVTAFI